MGRRGRENLINESCFFVTTTVVNHAPIFKHRNFCEILVNNFIFYKHKYEFKILSYVIMPSHFHWIIFINPGNGTISDIMRDMKKSTARQIFDFIDMHELKQYNHLFEKAANGIIDQNRKLWMKRFDDEVIRNDEMFRTKLNYIPNNPVKAGLVQKPDDYYFSSARNYMIGNNTGLLVEIDFAGNYF